MSADVVVEERGQVLVVTIDRPAQRNALTQETSRTIASAWDELDDRADLTVGVLTGAGGHFCAGMDLKRFLLGEVASIPGRGLGGMTQTPPEKPVIAAVEGYALAGGFEMALACDLVVAAKGAVFGLSEVQRGLAARAGGLLRLPEKIPENVAMEMILTGTPIGADRAAALGLVNRVVADQQALAAAMGLANEMASNAPLALIASKKVVTAGRHWTPDERWRNQASIVDPVFASNDAREGAEAFAAKRPPQWTGT
ncbi:crotonase/enoyl-CoA hydratase family protein [Amycolatopsis ultiminotia]|uniref:Crotonase/enoyl-CoA hydratase family protein n=1 Tax=Amycolatopsis ultiminotia TaxID=543629 RepID=A0ABP6XPC9_9PSEU